MEYMYFKSKEQQKLCTGLDQLFNNLMLVFVNSEISVIKLCPGPYVVPVWCFPSPYRSIHFSDIFEANRQETFSLGLHDRKCFGRAE